MYRDGKWAKQILSLQREDGSWGDFHTLSTKRDSTMVTEFALRRLERLGYTQEDEPVQKALCYMNDCLIGKRSIPDREEKVSDWKIFTELMLSADIRRFTSENRTANAVAKQWASVLSVALQNGEYDHTSYIKAYQEILKPCYGRINRPENYYPVSLLVGCLEPSIEAAWVHHLLHHETGIYYIYDQPLWIPPKEFQSKEASRYLAALELLADYPAAKEQLRFAVEWLLKNRNENGNWDMGQAANDQIYFPLSDDWRKPATREADSTVRITKLLNKLIP